MANVQLNVFENFPVLASVVNLVNQNSLLVQGIELPGSISFNNVVVLFQGQGTTAKTATLSLGLYSRTGNTLSLANSASMSTAPTANTLQWITLATSATQNLTPGNWFLACLWTTSGSNNMSLAGNQGGKPAVGAAYGGMFVHGFLSVSTSALPASIATSDLSREGVSTDINFNRYPYVLISA